MSNREGLPGLAPRPVAVILEREYPWREDCRHVDTAGPAAARLHRTDPTRAVTGSRHRVARADLAPGPRRRGGGAGAPGAGPVGHLSFPLRRSQPARNLRP